MRVRFVFLFLLVPVYVLEQRVGQIKEIKSEGRKGEAGVGGLKRADVQERIQLKVRKHVPQHVSVNRG